MRKLFIIVVAVLLTASVFLPRQASAQAPEKMSYQAVIRDANDNLITDTQIGMQISILQGSAIGTAVYVETQEPSTNANGLVSIEIGTGTTSDDFSTIDWTDGPYFIKTETDPAGGTTYTITGTSQLLSVPYALHAKTAETVSGGVTETDPVFTAWDKDYADLTNKPTTITTGQANAIVANTAKNTYPAADATKLAGIEEGAQINVQADWNQSTTTADDFIKNKPTIPAVVDGSETKVTAGTNVTVTGSGTTVSPYVVNATGGTSGSSSGDFYLGQDTLGGIVFYIYLDQNGDQHGLIVSKTQTTAKWQNTNSTTNANRSEDGAYNTSVMTNSPAKTWVTSFGADWYLPSIDELILLWQNRFHVNKTARAIGSTLLTNFQYWSSTETNDSYAFYFYFYIGGTDTSNKSNIYRVRAVQAF